MKIIAFYLPQFHNISYFYIKRENVQNITFLQGNAHDEKFLAECVTKEHWNVAI